VSGEVDGRVDPLVLEKGFHFRNLAEIHAIHWNGRAGVSGLAGDQDSLYFHETLTLSVIGVWL
jgi:hypothetical protein